jgi:hypothetical protein
MMTDFQPRNEEQLWWQTAWQEREAFLRRQFGETCPPQAVFPFSWNRIDLIVPGGCALVFPPSGHERSSWLHLSLGLTQPLCLSDVVGSDAPSGYGWEFGVLTSENNSWPLGVLFEVMTYLKESNNRIDVGHRVPMVFYKNGDGIQPALRDVEDADEQEPIGDVRAMLFWRYLQSSQRFVTSTGHFGILIGTAITGEEWEMAKVSSSTHLLLLMLRAGIGQVSDLSRSTVTTNPRWAEEWEVIRQYTQQEAEHALLRIREA